MRTVGGEVTVCHLLYANMYRGHVWCKQESRPCSQNSATHNFKVWNKPDQHCSPQRRCYQDGTESLFPERLKLQPTGNILMTNYILRCANSWRTKCRVRLNPAPQKDAIAEPGLWHRTQMRLSLLTSNKPAHYGGNNGDLSGPFQEGITPQLDCVESVLWRRWIKTQGENEFQ